MSIPTGSGKTAIGLAAPFLMPKAPRRVLVLAPGRHLRRQLVDQFRSYGQLKRLGVLANDVGSPSVIEMTGRSKDWAQFESADVVVALPNSISPLHYEPAAAPPTDLFQLIIVDEAHHAPADTWRAILEHFVEAHSLLLTATPRRRDGRRIPGSLGYYYPLRRAIDEGFYQPISPILLPPPITQDRGHADTAIADRVARLLKAAEHRTSVVLVRGEIGRAHV